MARKRKAEAESKDVERIAIAFLNAANAGLRGMRRPNIQLSDAKVEGLRTALRRAGGSLILPLEKAVELLGLAASYTDPERAHLLASSLSRKLKGITVGTRADGKYLSFYLHE